MTINSITSLKQQSCIDGRSIFQTFLASLSRPLKIADSKITRWHPSFPLDEVPDVEPAELPEPPYVKKFSSAKDVLAQATNIKDTKVSSRG